MYLLQFVAFWCRKLARFYLAAPMGRMRRRAAALWAHPWRRWIGLHGKAILWKVVLTLLFLRLACRLYSGQITWSTFLDELTLNLFASLLVR